MRLIKTLSRLKEVPRSIAALAHVAPGRPAASAGPRLIEIDPPADNPGALRGYVHVPAGQAGPMPLVVVLHGCTQTAAAYDAGSGWSRLAEARGFALLFPEQARANNPNLCFNWFQTPDTGRGRGEAASIAAMIAAVRAAHPIDAGRIFVTGLSAGGAMASAMLAGYPELFAAGAIIAGLPYGCASGVGEAFECMGGRGAAVDARTLAERVRAASSHGGPWPRVSVWHGSADQTVAPGNADAIVRQWTSVHGLPAAPTRTGSVDGYPHSCWDGADGVTAVELYSITGMGHGTPLMPGTGAGQSGEARAHMFDAGISSTDRIAAFFGLAPELADGVKASAPASHSVQPAKQADAEPHVVQPARQAGAAPLVQGSQKVIEDALRAAGLMR